MTLPARIVDLAEALRAEGLALGTSELLDAFAALEEIPWTDREPFREALAATLAKSPDDRRVFDLVFDRFFFRAVEEQAVARDVREQGDSDGMTGGEQIDLDNLREQALQAIRDGDESAMRDLARLAIAAFGRRGEGSGVLGVDVQRIRRALDLRTDGQPREDGAEPLTRDQIRRFEQQLRRELERAQIERTQALPPARPLNELDRALPSGPLQDLAAVHRVVMQLKRRLATQGHEARGRRKHAHVDVRRTMRASLQTGGVPVVLKFRPQRPRRPELYVLCDVSTSVTSASVFFLSVLHALHDSFRKMRSFVFVERISEVTDVFARERNFKAVSEAIGRDAGVADVSGYTDYGRVWREFLSLVEDDLHPRATVIVLGDARTNGRDPRADVFAAHRGARRAHVLAQPRAAAVLELRRLGRPRVRAVLRALRVLDDAPARGLRQGAHAAAARVIGAGLCRRAGRRDHQPMPELRTAPRAVLSCACTLHRRTGAADRGPHARRRRGRDAREHDAPARHGRVVRFDLPLADGTVDGDARVLREQGYSDLRAAVRVAPRAGPRAAGRRRGLTGAPLAVEQRVDDLVGPLPLDQLVLAARCASRRMPSRSSTRAEAALRRVQSAADPVQAEVLEADPQHRAGRLRRVPAALVGRIEDVADLALAVLLAAPEQRQVAHELARRCDHGREVERVALRSASVVAPLLLGEHAAQLVAIAHAEVEVAHARRDRRASPRARRGRRARTAAGRSRSVRDRIARGGARRDASQ